MSLIYVHGVRQRDPEGLKRLRNRLMTMMKNVASDLEAHGGAAQHGIDEHFEVRVPYWGNKASHSKFASVFPATLQDVTPQALEEVDSSTLGFTRDTVPEDELDAKGTLAAAPESVRALDSGNEATGGSSAPDLSALIAASRQEPNTVELLIRSFASEGLADDEKESIELLMRGGWSEAYAQTAPMTRGEPPQNGEELPAWLSKRAVMNYVGAVERAATVVALAMPGVRGWVDGAHRDVSMFLGDAMVVVLERERSGATGPIFKQLLSELGRESSGPRIVITHSMGASVVYDAVVRFAPELQIDCLITVGSQIAQFQNLGLFGSAAERDDKGRVVGLKKNFKRWWNVFDSCDFLNFVASPVFADAVDVSYTTWRGPSTAHSAYWGQPRFMALLQRLIVESLTTRGA